MSSESSAVLLKLDGVKMAYEGVGGVDGVTVLDGIDWKVDKGERVGILGPSGCGKSTLLNVIGALDQPTAGKVVLNGRDLAGLGEDALASVRNKEIGFIFQEHHLLPQCTVLENVLVPTLVGKGRNGVVERAKGLLDRAGLGDRMGHRPGQLSGGQRQRAAVVRALINEPALVLADEPTGSLDRRHAEEVGDLLVELNEEEGVTLVVVTHSIELARRMRKVYELLDGKIREVEF